MKTKRQCLDEMTEILHCEWSSPVQTRDTEGWTLFWLSAKGIDPITPTHFEQFKAWFSINDGWTWCIDNIGLCVEYLGDPNDE